MMKRFITATSRANVSKSFPVTTSKSIPRINFTNALIQRYSRVVNESNSTGGNQHNQEREEEHHRSSATRTIVRRILHPGDNSLQMGVILLAICLSGTLFFTSDTFLAFLIRRVIHMYNKYYCEEGEELDIQFEKVNGCFFCGGVKFINFDFKRRFPSARDGETSVTMKFHATELTGVIAFDKMVNRLVKQWFNELLNREAVEHDDIAVIIPKLAVFQGQMEVDVKYDQKAEIVPKSVQTNATTEEVPVHALFGDLRIFDSSVKFNFMRGEGINQHTESSVWEIKDFILVEPVKSSDWLFGLCFRTISHGQLDGQPFTTDIIVSEQQKDNQATISDYYIKWRIENYPLSKIGLVHSHILGYTLRKDFREILATTFHEQSVSMNIQCKEMNHVEQKQSVINFDCQVDFHNKANNAGSVTFDFEAPVESFTGKKEFQFARTIAGIVIRKGMSYFS